MTNNLHARTVEHREKLLPGFTSKYNICRLVHFETFGDIRVAIAREKEIKGWRRQKRIWLIKRHNPRWGDLAAEWFPRGAGQKAGSREPENAKGNATADPSPPPKPRLGSG